MSDTTSRLLIISNRLPIQLTERGNKVSMRESDGGLVSALKSYFDKTTTNNLFTEKIWIGSADFPEERWARYKAKNTGGATFEIEPLFVPAKEYNHYYNGFCNATLWPLFHYFPSYTEYSDDTFKSYEEVNELFSEKILSILKPGDTVWIHDYQLMLLPGMIREKRPDVSIGFFLHIPFPSYEIFRLLHNRWKERIIHGLLGSDLIGFHTHEYLQHFLDSVQRTIGLTHKFRQLNWQGRKVKANIFPLGIDYEKFHDMPDTPEVKEEKNAIIEKFGQLKVIFSVDRLDYTKGITHRLSGFERFLELYPAWREKVIFILVVVPSRQIISKYNERRKMIEEQVSRINGRYSTLQWQPILYRYNTLKFWELNVMYQVAHAALITPLRDGMNLVAKEFAASRKQQDGVLILSELAGAAHEMTEAILVNPTDKNEVAHAISQALGMEPSEQRERMAELQKRLKKQNVVNWVASFFDDLDAITKAQRNAVTVLLNDELSINIKSEFEKAKTRLIFLDYDGTLVPFQNSPEAAIPTIELLNWLKAAALNPRNQIVIISGRNLDALEKWFGDLPIHLIAEHGTRIRQVGSDRSTETIAPFVDKELIRNTFEMFSERCPGSFIEEKRHSLAWHYRNVDEKTGFLHSRELMDCLFHLLRNSSFNLIDGNKVIEVRPSTVDKGTAALLLKQQINPGITIAIGDDVTDEDMFDALREDAITIKVGEGETKAKFRLPAQQHVDPFLQTLIKSIND